MSVATWIDLAVAGFALVMLAAAGTVEASFARRQRLTIRQLLEQGGNGGDSEDVEGETTRLRSSVDVSTLIAVLLLGISTARIGLRETESGITFAALALGVAIVLFAVRAVPFVIVDRYRLTESPFVHHIASFLSVLVSPFAFVMNLATAGMGRVVGRSENGNGTHTNGSANGHDAEGNGDEDEHEDEIQEIEHEMITGILSMENALAREIMVPRPDVVAVPVEASIPDVVEIAREAGHSRIPAYRDSIDEVQGIVYVKDLLRFVTDEFSSVQLSDLLRPATFVPESKPLDELLRDLRRSRVHIAIVVDEYGGMAGIVTIEDILEEIVGEIQDEYDREVPLYELDSTGAIRVDGRISVDELNELIDVELPETESETAGGFVQRQMGHIPEAGDVLEVDGLAFHVESVEGRRIKSLRIQVLEESLPLDSSEPIQA